MTSTSKIDESLKSKIRSLVKQVVVAQHVDPNKRMLKEMPGRISLACPYCGDSTTDTKKKRGNLYWESLQYHCFNCGTHNDVYSLLKDHHVNSTFDHLAFSANNMAFYKKDCMQINGFNNEFNEHRFL